MTDAVPDDPDDPDDQAPADPGRRLALTFEAFRATHHTAWLRYAHLQAGCRAEARRIVDQVCAHLASNWPHALQQPSVAAYAWAVLKERIARPAAVRTRCAPDSADGAEGVRGIRLYSAVSRLPERQYDVIVLRYALGYGDERVARLLGLKENTVRSLLRFAKRRLSAGQIGAVPGPGTVAPGRRVRVNPG